MDNNTYVMFIEKVIAMTKKNELKWKYLDTDEKLCKGMNWRPSNKDNILLSVTESMIAKHFDDENSFMCCKNDVYFVLFVGNNNTIPTLHIIPYTYKGTVMLKPDIYGDYITRLHNLVKRQFPHADNFIMDFINEK